MPGRRDAPGTQASWTHGRTAARLRLPFLIYIAAAVAIFALEGHILWVLGYNYQGLTGSPLTKIHPGTYLVVLSLICLCFEHADPVGTVVGLAARRPGSVLLLIAALVQMVCTIVRKGPGAAGIVDVFVLAPLAAMMFASTDAWTRGKLEQVLHGLMIVNAMMGLSELAFKFPFFPFRLDGEYSIYDLRPTALQGHPLANASVTSVYTLALISGGGTIPGWPRAGIIALELAALVAFGGRSGLVVTVILGGLYALGMVFRVMRRGRLPLLGTAVAVLALTVLPLGIGSLAAGGFFDAILLRFENDGGSAVARIKIMDLFSAIPLGDLLVGPDPELVEALRHVNGLDLGIENPIARIALNQGLIVTAFTILAFALFLREIVKVSRPGMLLPMTGFLIVINTFESLGGKSALLTKFALMMLVLYRPATGGPRPGGVRKPVFDRERSPRRPMRLHRRLES